MKFSELQNEAQKIYTKLRAESERVRSEKENIRERYSQKTASDMCVEVDTTFKAFANACADEFNSKVEACLSFQRATVEKACAEPPTTEQVNLLSALQMRAEMVSENELASLVSALAPNYQAVTVLQALAKKSGKRLHLSDKYNFDALNTALSEVEPYLRERVQNLRDFRQHVPGAVFNPFFVEGYHDPIFDRYVSMFE